MKRNALFRIILWSIVIAILTTALVGVGFGISFNRRRPSAEEVLAVTTPPEASIAPYDANATVTANVLNVRSMPAPDAPVMGMLKSGDALRVTRVESVSGEEWAYVTDPVAGWVVREYLNLSEVPQEVQGSVYPASDADPFAYKDTFPASSIRELEIEWAAGDIKIYPGTTDQITVQEDGVTDDKYTMSVQWDEDTLEIRFSQREFNLIGLNNIPEKDLTITVPVDWYCESLEIDAASANLEVCGLSIGEVDINGASGICEFENCTVQQLNIDTASGDVRFVGSLNILDCDAASANIYAVLTNVPNRLDMDTMSGDLELTLPKDAGFVLSMDALSEKLDTDFEISRKDGKLVSGDGACRIRIDALIGDVIIRKGE